MKILTALLAAGMFAGAGCANQLVIPPPGIHHPADPLAESAPVPPPSTTLVATPSEPDLQSPDVTSVNTENSDGMSDMNHGSH